MIAVIGPNPIQSNPIQSNPWMDPIHVQLWAKLTNPKKQSNQVCCVAQFLIGLPVAE